MTEAMAARARASARAAGLANVEVRLGDALALPIQSDTVDVVTSNGVINLTPDKAKAFGEVFRVLKPGGEFLYGDIVVADELSASIKDRFDCFRGTSKERTAIKYGVLGMNVYARKPLR